MNFKEVILLAQEGNDSAQEEILNRYKPLLLKESVIDGIFDEDLYQELCLTLLNCIHKFQV